MLEIKNVYKTFNAGTVNEKVALRGLELTLQDGDFVTVIGGNGAGKSTMLNAIAGVWPVDMGKILVDGQDITTLSPKELRKARQSITMIFQGFNLLMQRSALDNICFPLELSGTPRKEAVARARELLKVVGLEGREGAYPAQLSGGQKQRVAIARALATNPKVLLCDEATSALDPTTTQSILALLQELNRTLGVTVVIITHEMKVVEQICGRVAILAESHVVEEGKVSEVFRHPKTAAARQLLMPGSETARETLAHGRAYRITFDGSTAEQPVVSGMVLSCGEPVNILFADMKNIEGKTYGQMLLQLPENEGAAARMLAYLESQRITYTEEEVK